MRIMDDVNLDRLDFGKDGRTVRLEFIDMRRGDPACTIECREVILLNYHSAMDEEGLAVYVGEVNLEEVSGDEARTRLRDLGYGFRDGLGRISITESGTVYHLHVGGGEIYINICCGECHLTWA